MHYKKCKSWLFQVRLTDVQAWLLPIQETQVQLQGQKIPPGEGNGNPLQYSYLEKPHGQSNLVDYGPCFKQLNTIQWLNNRQQRWSVFARTSYYGKPRNFSPNAVVIKLNIVLKYYRNKHSTFRNMAWFSKKLQAKIQQLLLTRSN